MRCPTVCQSLSPSHCHTLPALHVGTPSLALAGSQLGSPPPVVSFDLRGHNTATENAEEVVNAQW